MAHARDALVLATGGAREGEKRSLELKVGDYIGDGAIVGDEDWVPSSFFSSSFFSSSFSSSSSSSSSAAAAPAEPCCLHAPARATTCGR